MPGEPHYPQQVSFRDGHVVVTLLGPDDGFVTAQVDGPVPTAGELAAQEGREVGWKLGDEPTTATTAEGVAGTLYCNVVTPYERAEERARVATWLEAVGWCAALGLAVQSDEPDFCDDMGEVYVLEPVSLG